MENRIRQLREKGGLTQETLAIELEITQQQLSKYERNIALFLVILDLQMQIRMRMKLNLRSLRIYVTGLKKFCSRKITKKKS